MAVHGEIRSIHLEFGGFTYWNFIGIFRCIKKMIGGGEIWV
jgi:hypothetical protein